MKEINAENHNIYPDLKNKYKEVSMDINKWIKEINTWVDEVVRGLEEKEDNPFTKVAEPRDPNNIWASCKNAHSKLKELIDEHDNRVANHERRVSSARKKIELHLIAKDIKEKGYKKNIEDLKEAERKEKDVRKEMEQKECDINKLEKRTSNISKAINEINKHLKEFFEGEEIKVELNDGKKGYTISRAGQRAKNLSESEKTAIAFSYFIVKVGERDFNKSQGIIFIDDPISSFDSNFIYHCFSMMKNHFNEVSQLFISTHNFQFFSLVKEWFINKENSTKREYAKLKSENKNRKANLCAFFMIKNSIGPDGRKAEIVELDKTLKKYKSEYNFLFAKLKEFSKKEEPQYEDFYILGNMARRFFDMFADFKIPNTGDSKSKMEELTKTINGPNEKISTVDASKVYKLLNEFSHNSDPTSATGHTDKGEIQIAIKVLLKIVKGSDPKHYKILNKD